jgi:hypothetical protein
VSHPFQYVTLRYVPRVDRGEFVNVGVVLYSQSAGLLVGAWELDEPRLRALDPHVDLEALRASLGTLVRVCAGEDAPGLPSLPTDGKRFGWLAAPRSTVIQPGPLHGGECADPSAALEDLLRRLVRMEPGP